MGALGRLGIVVTQLHSESAAGQFEIVTSHKPAFEVRSRSILLQAGVWGFEIWCLP